MAEASSLASTIDQNFLECGICFEPFDNPKGLPCLHAFCCKCLIRWAKSCSDDQSVVSCPLCKKICQIPEVDVFPAHFMVTNLREAVDVERQTTSLNQYCENHVSETKRYFCENCGLAICSDCCVIDPVHKGHTFMRLKEAAEKQANFLQNLFEESKEVEQKYKIAIKETEQVAENLQCSTNTAKNAVDCVKERFMQTLEGLVEKLKHSIDTTNVERSKEIEHIKKKLQDELTQVKSAYEKGTAIVNSGSEYEITNIYLSLSDKLQHLNQSEPIPADSTLSHIEFEPAEVEVTSIGWLSCEKQKTVNRHNRRSQSCASDLSSDTSLTTSENTTSNIWKDTGQIKTTPKAPGSLGIPAYSTFGNSEFEPAKDEVTSIRRLSCEKQGTVHRRSQPGAGNLSTDISLTASENTDKHSWKESGQIKTTFNAPGPLGIAVNQHGDIAVTSSTSPVSVFSRNGDCMHVLQGSPFKVHDIAVTPTNEYVVPGRNGFHSYNFKGIHLAFSPTYNFYSIFRDPSIPRSVAVDSKSNVIVAAGFSGHRTVSIHQLDGTLISKFRTHKPPCKLTCTPKDELVISFEDHTLQMMDQSGHDARIIQPPPHVHSWEPACMCCSKQGELFVGNFGNPNAVYRYVYVGRGFTYSDCITTMEYDPLGIALSANEDELYVVDYLGNSVKIFQ